MHHKFFFNSVLTDKWQLRRARSDTGRMDSNIVGSGDQGGRASGEPFNSLP